MRFSRGLMAFSSHPVLRWWSPGWVVPSWPLGQFRSWMLPLGWTGLGFILPSGVWTVGPWELDWDQWEPANPPGGSHKAKEDIEVQCAHFAFKLRLQHF